MAKYNNELLAEMCSKVDFLDYVSNTHEVKKMTGRYYIKCPVHNGDNDPSMIINQDTGRYHCFGCGVNGNLLTFMLKVEKLPWNKALTKLQSLSGMQCVQLKQCDALAFYKQIKKVMEKKGKVVERRVLSPDCLEKFKDELPQEWIEEGISADAMKKFEIRIDDKANRIVYPVYDDNLDLIGFKGRTRFENYKDLKIVKYMNYQKLVTTDFFQGMKQNKNHILSTSKVIVVEGLKSVMKLDDYGINYGLAAETSCINDEQIKILIRMGIKDITIAFDKGIEMEKIRKCASKLKRFANVYTIVDRHGLLQDKDAPVDQGKEVWEQLYKERIKL